MKQYARIPLNGEIEVYRVRDGIRSLVFQKENLVNSTLYSNLRNVLISEFVNYGVDAIAWGSWRHSAGSYTGADFAGTTGLGTKGGLFIQSIGNLQAKFGGTFSFTSTKLINRFELGMGYQGAGYTTLFTNLYAFDYSLSNGTTNLIYDAGDQLIVQWTIQIGN